MARGLALAALAAAAASAAAFTVLPEHSLAGPFSTFDGDGMRKLDNWRLGGHAALQEYFLRLTNDRQSKRSYAWNTARLDRDEWSVTLRFRVSGQGKRLFGDGLAFWFTNVEHHRDGQLHGFTDTFKGFGVIFDTFVNTEPGHVHKDIQLISSDGSAPKTLSEGTPIGCDSAFRYWEQRDDFSVANHSAARIRFAGNKVSVWIDAKADGNWAQCIADVPLAAPEGWHREGAWLGLTATTGDLADNHDILSLQTGPEDEVAPVPSGSAGLGPRPEFLSTGNQQTDDAIKSAVASEMYTVQERMGYIHHHMEHQLTAMEDSLKIAMKKLADAEKDNTRRIEELEKRLGAKVAQQVEGAVDNSVAARLSRLEAGLTESVGSKVNRAIANDLMPKVAATAAEHAAAHGRNWLLPFVGLSVLMVASSVWGFRTWAKLRKLEKTHLL